MRVTQSMIYEQVMKNLGRATERLARDQLQLSTGRDINKPSDDPVGAQSVLSLKSKLKEIERYLTNIDNGVTHINLVDNEMDELTNLVGRMKEIAVQGSSDSVGSDTRETLAVEVDQLVENLVEIANTKVNDVYLFGGTNTKTKPFAATRDATTNRITAVNATGDLSGIFYREVASGTRIQANLPGDAVFIGAVPIFDLAIELRDALRNNDRDGVENTLERIDELTQLISVTRTQLGARAERLQSLREQLLDTQLQLIEFKSDKEDVDLTEAVAQLAQDELQYQAALAAATKIMQTNLVDFLQ